MDCIAVTGGSGDSGGTIMDDVGAEGLENDFPAVFAGAEAVVRTVVISGTVLDLGVKLGRAGRVEVRMCEESGPCVFGFAAEAGLVDQEDDNRPSGPKAGAGAAMGAGIKYEGVGTPT